MLVKHDIHHDAVDFLWPQTRRYEFEEHESLDFIYEGRLVTSKWMEDPDYHEEIIIRDMADGAAVDRRPGFLTAMPDGSRWLMTR